MGDGGQEPFRDTEDLDGLFSGYDRETGRYDIKSWQYEGVDDVVAAAGHKGTAGALALRFAIAQAGKASARDPRATFEPQRAGAV